MTAIGAAGDGGDLDAATPDIATDDGDLPGTEWTRAAPWPDDDLAGVGARGLT